MCMQDLAISRNVTWRPLPLSDDPQTGAAVLPPNPNRVVATATQTSSREPVNWRLGRSTNAPPVGGWFDSVALATTLPFTLTVMDYPGLFSTPLFSSVAASGMEVWEAVLDPGIGRAVEAVADEFRQLGSK